MQDSIFRAYDIRGTVGKQFILESVPELGQAIAYFFHTQYPHVKKIVIGRDPRIHSPFIKEQLIQSFLKSGYDVFDIDLSSSPLVYFALHTEQFDAGVIVTASHNSKDDNGIKINVGKSALSPEEIQKIKTYFFQKKTVGAATPGTYQSHSVMEKYITFLKNQFVHLINNPISCIIDCANGSAGPIVTQLITQMKWKNVLVLHSKPDGSFPNHNPNPHDIKNWNDVKENLKQNFEFGIGLDGDADRMGVMTKSGHLLSGDMLLSFFAQFLFSTIKHPTIICNVLASDILLSHLTAQGAHLYTVPVGNPVMRKEMKEKHAHIGGETSGHFFFQDRYFGFDDGIYAMMRFIEAYISKKDALYTLLTKCISSFVSPEIRIFCSEEQKASVMKTIKHYFCNTRHSCVDGIRVCFDTGWLIIRPSNTESVLSIRFEGKTEKDFLYLKNEIAASLPEPLRHDFLAHVHKK